MSGADEQGPRDAVVMAVDCTKILWLLRLDGDPFPLLWAALEQRSPTCSSTHNGLSADAPVAEAVLVRADPARGGTASLRLSPVADRNC